MLILERLRWLWAQSEIVFCIVILMSLLQKFPTTKSLSLLFKFRSHAPRPLNNSTISRDNNSRLDIKWRGSVCSHPHQVTTIREELSKINAILNLTTKINRLPPPHTNKSTKLLNWLQLWHQIKQPLCLPLKSNLLLQSSRITSWWPILATTLQISKLSSQILSNKDQDRCQMLIFRQRVVVWAIQDPQNL